MEENQITTSTPPVADPTVLNISEPVAPPDQGTAPSMPYDPPTPLITTADVAHPSEIKPLIITAEAAHPEEATPSTFEATPFDFPEASLTEINKARICVRALRAVERDIANVIRLMESGAGDTGTESVMAAMPGIGQHRDEEMMSSISRVADGRVIEGVFDGQNMVGSDGNIYTVPPNYASKSKLVEGDMLKLTITPKGSFIYKQIGPIERSRVIADLGYDVTINEYYAVTDNRRWSILKASVTYYKGEPGDEVVLLVPKSAPSKWAAVENVIKKNPLA